MCPPTTRVAAGTWRWAKGTGEGLLVLLVLPRGRRLHQGGTDSVAFSQVGEEQGGVHGLV